MNARKLCFLFIAVFVATFAISTNQGISAPGVVKSYPPAENEYMIFIPGSHTFMLEDHANALSRIIQNMHYESTHFPATILTYPNIQSTQIVIGDLSHPNSGHPGGSHRDNKTFDMDYYTYGGDNRTQYGCAGGLCSGIPYVCDPDTGRCYSGKLFRRVGDLIKVKDSLAYYEDPEDDYGFDWKRNWLFWKKIHDVFPNCRIMINTLLCECIKYHLRNDLGYNTSQVSQVSTWLQGDNNISWQHDKHAHVLLGDTIDTAALNALPY